MGSSVQCFFVTPTLRAKCSLRRYTDDPARPCAENGYHNAHTPIGERSVRESERFEGCIELVDDAAPERTDSRWPTKCDTCGAEFDTGDRWQLFYDVIYVRTDTGAEMTLREATPGAMWDAKWWPGKGPDGLALYVKLPPGGPSDEWFIDGPANNGGGWTRSGEVPNVTANPSILTKRYHGFLRNGWLEEC